MPNRSSNDIKFVNNWNQWYELDGERMKPGILNVLATFPDGSTKDIQVEVVAGTQMLSDHGHEQSYAYDKIVLHLEHHGLAVKHPWSPNSDIFFVWYDESKPTSPEEVVRLRRKVELADQIIEAAQPYIKTVAPYLANQPKRDGTEHAVHVLKSLIEQYQKVP